MTRQVPGQGRRPRSSQFHRVKSHRLRRWRYQLAVFAHVVAQEQHANAVVTIDRWFSLWTEKDVALRTKGFAEIAIEGVSFRDPWGCVAGIDELGSHVGAVQLHMFAKPERRGDVRHGQGVVVVEWVAIA